MYWQITRGAAPRAHAAPLPAVPPTVFAFAKLYTPPTPERLISGVSCILFAGSRWGGCGIKTTSLLPNTLSNTAARDA